MELGIKGLVSDTVKEKCTCIDFLIVDTNHLMLFANYSDFEIPLNQKFTILKEDKKEYAISASLIGVTQQFNKVFDSIPMGWKTIIVLRLDEGDFDKLKSLPAIDNWWASNRELYLIA